VIEAADGFVRGVGESSTTVGGDGGACGPAPLTACPRLDRACASFTTTAAPRSALIVRRAEQRHSETLDCLRPKRPMTQSAVAELHVE
jgi:hypothetical protein